MNIRMKSGVEFRHKETRDLGAKITGACMSIQISPCFLIKTKGTCSEGSIPRIRHDISWHSACYLSSHEGGSHHAKRIRQHTFDDLVIYGSHNDLSSSLNLFRRCRAHYSMLQNSDGKLAGFASSSLVELIAERPPFCRKSVIRRSNQKFI